MTSSKVLPKGLLYDRRWMLIDESGTFITQRLHSKLAFFRLSLTGEEFAISFNKEQIHLRVDAPISTIPVSATIWDDTVEVFEVLGDYSEWFSLRLGVTCRLVYFPETNLRPVDEKYSIENDQVSLADGYPFLIVGQSSLDDLNMRLETPIPMNRFRPNFVFTGGKPYEEDNWRNFTIRESRFIGVKPCGRCLLITVNQETAKRGTEPLATLATYRKTNNKIHFGQNLLALTCHEIYEGDSIQLVS